MITSKTSPFSRGLFGAIAPLVAATAILATSGTASAQSQKKIDKEAQLAARNEAAAANIEQIVNIAHREALKMGTGAMKMSGKNIKVLTRNMVGQAISKTPLDNDPNNVNRFANKADEIVEIAAFIVSGFSTSEKFLKKGNPHSGKMFKAIFAVLRNFNGVIRKTAPIYNYVNTGDGHNPATGSGIFRDLAGSVALTIRNNAVFSNPAVYSSIVQKLTKKSKKVGGKAQQAEVERGYTDGFNGPLDPSNPDSPLVRYEDGNNDLLKVADPETDQRNA